MQFIIFTFLFVSALTSEVDEDYTLPLFPKVKQFVDYVDEDDSYLGRDRFSGCACRHSSKKWVVCFGAEFCVRFPKNLAITENVLKIRTSNIKKIQKEDLKNFGHLIYLEIEANYNLEYIEPGAFKGMMNLRNLSISYNRNLHTLEYNTFEGLDNLSELVLVKNGLNNIHKLALALTPQALPSLKKLKLNENTFFHIRKDDLAPMNGSSLEEIGLILCQIEYIHPDAFLPLRNLTAVRLGENTFNTSVITEVMASMIKHRIPLKKFNLYGVGFRKTPPKELMEIMAMSNVTILNLAHNQFEILTKASFPPMPNLLQLDLRDVLALDVSADTFSGMPNLETLLLSGNKIPSVPDGVLLPQLKYLDLSSNSGNIFNPSYFSLGKNKFVNMSKLWGLNISFNNIRVLFNYSFVGLSGLEILGLRNASLKNLGNNTFSPMEKLIFLDLENNPFPKNSGLNKESFAGLRRLQVLLLGGCSISYIDPNNNPFLGLVALKHLGLDRNNLKVISPSLFSTMRRLSRVNIEQNFLTSWQDRLFSNNRLEHLQASHNKFTYFSRAMLQDFSNLTELDASKNPFTCDCNLFVTIKDSHMINKNITLLDLISEEHTYCVYPDDYSNITLVDYYNMVANNTKLCYYAIANPVIKYSLFIIILSIIILCVLIIGYRYRWYIRYWMFLTRIAIIRKGKILQKAKTLPAKEYEYDAFVSYSNEDRNFVVRLVAMLENYEPFLKLCVYERDFQVGSVISETVLESVAKSRKTLLVVSNSYVRSQWCCWEAQVAENYRLFFQNEYGDLVNDSIVVIKLGDVGKTHMTPMLKYLMKTRIYLQWDPDKSKQKIFWEKLRNVLSCPKRIEESDA